MSSSSSPKYGIAFAVSIGAGLSTALGAAIVFVPSLVQYAKRKTLAAALGFSSGVMLYVSLVDMLPQAINWFQQAGNSENIAYSWATCSFFGGVILMLFLNYLVTTLLGTHCHSHGNDLAKNPKRRRRRKAKIERQETAGSTREGSNQEENGEDQLAHSEHSYIKPICTPDRAKAYSFQSSTKPKSAGTDDSNSPYSIAGAIQDVEELDIMPGQECGELAPTTSKSKQRRNISPHADNQGRDDHVHNHRDQERLMRMSLNTAIAICLHNFPEGLATFVATLHDVKVGVVVAVAIAIHNIPEGLCVAMPIYYATGDRWKAFRWGVLSGISEPLAALLGFAVLANTFNETAFAVLFGLVPGMMTLIVVKELLPTAYLYDKNDKVVSISFTLGMAIIALSLILFLV